ncbi:hypothetical protein BDR26DRAFT_874613 [Obelidium mucronatum]|nr:hypothetical protein BDR26DRAFT_874613 [Obelidium mucronatum]
MVDTIASNNNNNLPVYISNNNNSTGAEELPAEPKLSPTRSTTVRGTLNVYLLVFPILYVGLIVAYWKYGHGGFNWVNIILGVLIVGVNGLMHIAIQRQNLIVWLMNVFILFYVTRSLVELGITISILVDIGEVYKRIYGSSYNLPWTYYTVVVGGLVIDCLVTVFMVKHAFTMRAYAVKVQQIKRGTSQVVAMNKV